MKSSALLGALLAAATGVAARCVKPSGLPACHAGKCLQGLYSEDLGKDFCSVFLSLPPVPSTATVTVATETVTTYTSTQTDLTTTVETSTITSVTTALSTSYVFQRRDIENPAAARILSACATKAARISSACSCFLSITVPVPVPAPTTTVLATATTVISLATTIASTETETTLTTTTTTASDLAIATIPSNPILNGNFGSYNTDRHIRPWTNTTTENPGSKLEFLPGASVCASNDLSYCSTGSLAVVYPPSIEGGFVDLVQTFRAKPNTQYSVDFLYRCFVAKPPAARVEVFYNGVTRGASLCPDQSIGFVWPRNRFYFTTDGTGVGEVKLRFYNCQESQQQMYHYIAEIRATVATGPY